jgi:hypothetical protein
VLGMDPHFWLYVLDVLRGQTSADEWINALSDLILKWKPIRWAAYQPIPRQFNAYRRLCALRFIPTRSLILKDLAHLSVWLLGGASN